MQQSKSKKENIPLLNRARFVFRYFYLFVEADDGHENIPGEHRAQIFQILKKVGVKLYQIFP